MLTQESQKAALTEVNDFRVEAMAQLDGFLVGEEVAKKALLLGMLMGRNVALIGGTGSGKTELARDGWRLIEDIQGDVVNLDTKDDLEPKEITGATVPVKQPNGLFLPQYVEGMLRPTTKVLIANEINRTSPSALNTILEVFEKREMEVNGQIVSLNGLQYAIATLNPGEGKQNVHILSQANASRFELGALMGEDPDSNERRRKAIHEDDFDEKAKKPSSVVSIADLRAMRETARKGVSYTPAAKHGMKLSERIGDVFAQRGINERGGRLDIHIKRTAKAITALDGRSETTPEDINEAARYVTTAVIGMTATRNGIASISEAHQELGIAA